MEVLNQERMQWKRRFDFLFTSIGYTIGLGNVWRFPERCYRNGGGAFLFPYFMTVILCTIPMVFLEMSLGQFASEGPLRIWKISPIFTGVGWAIMFIIFVTSIYYITLLMYSLYYMMVSFVNIGGILPWQQCRPYDEWSTEACLAGNISTEETYWNRFVLGEHVSDGMHDLREVVGRNLCLLLIMWLIVYYCCIRGIRSIAKVIYVTATFPLGLIIILLVRGMTLTGYEDGLGYYLKADWSKLSEMQIWSNAANQAMYSMGVAYGSHIALSSHNKFHNNVFADALIVCITNTLTSFLLGLIVFSFIGHASYKLNIPIENMIDQGPGLLFVTYIQGLTQLPGSSIWSVLFFLMVFTIGLDSTIVMLWTMASSIEDSFPKLGKRGKYSVLIGLCVVMFLLGIPMTTKGGIHMMVLIDRYVADIGLATLLLCQSVSVCWVYGINNFIGDIEMMIGKKPRYFWWYWRATWMITVPILCLCTLIASCVGYVPSSYQGKVIPPGGEAIGWMIIMAPLILVVVGAILQVRKHKGVKAALKKSDDWGPRCEENRYGEYATTMINVDKLSGDAPSSDGGRFNVKSETYDMPNEAYAQDFELQNRLKGPDVAGSYKALSSSSTYSGSETRSVGAHAGHSIDIRPNLHPNISDVCVAPPRPHRLNSSEVNTPDDIDDDSPRDGYITAIIKRPAPAIPSEC